MTIYDVPVSDTKFFPVSGDMLRQMKHEEENGTGSPAKNSPDAADLNNHQGEQITMNDTATLPENPDVSFHPIWCNPDACIPPFDEEDDDVTLHVMSFGELQPRAAHPARSGITVDLVQANHGRPMVLITNGDDELDVDEVDRLMSMLSRAQMRLMETGEV